MFLVSSRNNGVEGTGKGNANAIQMQTAIMRMAMENTTSMASQRRWLISSGRSTACGRLSGLQLSSIMVIV